MKTVPQIRVFLASPSGVNEEYAIALEVPEILEYDLMFKHSGAGGVSIHAIAWDKPSGDTAMRATKMPQKAIKQELLRYRIDMNKSTLDQMCTTLTRSTRVSAAALGTRQSRAIADFDMVKLNGKPFSGWHWWSRLIVTDAAETHSIAEGVTCGCKTKSVPTYEIESEVRNLLTFLTISEEHLPLMVEISMQSENGANDPAAATKLESQKAAVIAKCRKIIAVATEQYDYGDIDRKEYLARVEKLEREIAAWESRTTDTQQVAVELKVVLNMVAHMAQVWDMSNDEDRQPMAHMSFEYIVYDWDERRIVESAFKAWAARYLTVRAEMYRWCDPNENRSSLNEKSDLCPIRNSTSPPYISSSKQVCSSLPSSTATNVSPRLSSITRYRKSRSAIKKSANDMKRGKVFKTSQKLLGSLTSVCIRYYEIPGAEPLVFKLVKQLSSTYPLFQWFIDPLLRYIIIL